MDPQLEGLAPEKVWKHFDALMRIPRCSKHEERAVEYVVEFARSHELEYERDHVGNVVVRKGASPGREGAPTVVVQGHVDMVCEKNADVAHDFSTDPIRPDMRGERLYAKGTTLGADNGVGVAMCLALLESDDIVHGPIEGLFTIDEETGLTGAFELGGDFLGGRKLMNLDSEDMSVVTIGCSGGGDSLVKLPLGTGPAPGGWTEVRLVVSGLKGGHSGVDIHEHRANAVKLLTRVLWEARGLSPIMCCIEGGDKHNAIPREARARVAVTNEAAGELEALASRCEADFKAEYGSLETSLSVAAERVAPEGGSFAPVGDTARAVRLLMALPHGIEKFSHDVEGLVETSTNLASVRFEDGVLVVHHSTRSSIAPALEALRGRIEAMAVTAGATVEHGAPYPGWQPNPQSELLALAKRVHQELFGSEPVVEAIHAGLETGIIGEKFPGMDMVSIGPTIANPHSPDEYVEVPTVEATWRWVLAILAALAG